MLFGFAVWLFCCQAVLAAGWNCSATSGAFTLSSDCVLYSEIVVSGELEIQGKEFNYSTVRGGGQQPPFLVDGTFKLTLGWIKLIGGHIVDGRGGGSIYAKQINRLTVVSCIFFNNSAFPNSSSISSTAYGGAILLEDTTAHIVSTVFRDNVATDGGAVFLGGGDVKIKWSAFEYNEAKIYGGAIFATGGTYQITDTTFKSNNGRHGGGAYLAHSVGSLENSFFFKNTASLVGGGVAFYGGNSPVEWILSNVSPFAVGLP